MKKIFVIVWITAFFFGVNAQNGIKTIEHTVEKGQTLYFLSKKYDMSIEDIMRFNPQIGKDMIIKEGMAIKLYAKPTPQLNVDNHKYHTVEKGQTLYSLSKMYDISVDKLIYLNQLENPSIKIGQKLIVQNVDGDALYADEKKPNQAESIVEKQPTKLQPPVKPVKEEEPKQPTPKPSTNNKDVEMYKMLYESYAQSGALQNKAKGIGNFLAQSTSKDVYLALIKNVETGQVLRVRNLMNNKVIYLKVIGDVPEKDKKNNISIKISKAAARDLGIIEDRFLAEWTWYKKKEEAKKTINKSLEISDF